MPPIALQKPFEHLALVGTRDAVVPPGVASPAYQRTTRSAQVASAVLPVWVLHEVASPDVRPITASVFGAPVRDDISAASCAPVTSLSLPLLFALPTRRKSPTLPPVKSLSAA